MAQNNLWFTVNLNEATQVHVVHGSFFTEDNLGAVIGAHVMNGSKPEQLDGSASGYIMRSDGKTIVVSGNVEGNNISIELPESAVAVPGQIQVAIRLTSGEVKNVLLALTGYVQRSTTNAIIDPGHVIPDIDDIIAKMAEVDTKIAAATQATNAANAAATAAENVNISMSKADGVITIVTTDKTGAQTTETVTDTSEDVAELKDEVTDLKSAYDGLGIESVSPTSNWTIGGLNGNMVGTVDNSKRARIMGAYLPQIPDGYLIKISIAEGYLMRAAVYDARSFASKVAILTPGSDFVSGEVRIPSEYAGKYWGCNLKKEIDADFTDEEIAGLPNAITVNVQSVVGDLNNLPTTDKETVVGAIAETYSRIDTKAPAIYETISAPMASFTDGADDMPLKQCVVQIEPVQEGGGDPSPENIRPIEGWTAIQIHVANENLVDWDSLIVLKTRSVADVEAKYEDGFYDKVGTATANKAWSLLATSTGTATYYTALSLSNRMRLPEGTYRCSKRVIYGTNSAGNYKSTGNGSVDIDVPFTMPEGGGYVNPVTVVSKDREYNEHDLVYLCKASETSTPVLHNGKTYDVSLPAEAGTVYGGTLTINQDGSGNLIIDKALITLTGEEDYTKSYDDKAIYWTSALSNHKVTNTVWSDRYTPTNVAFSSMPNYSIRSNNSNTSTAPRVYIRDDRCTTVEDFKANIAGTQVLYELRNPVPYTLSALDVIRTLFGVNNIFADAGPVTVEYPADTKLYIDRKNRATRSLIAGIESTMTASKSYSAGDLLIVGDTLYKATLPIANGETFTPGTNVTTTTVAEQLLLLANA